MHFGKVKRLIEYLKLFISVNDELIADDIHKKNRGKSTHRHPITPEFVEATTCMKTILELFKKIRVVSVTQIKGVKPFSFDESWQEIGDDDPQFQNAKLKTLYHHFVELSHEQQRKCDTVVERNSHGDQIFKRAMPLIYIHDLMKDKMVDEVEDEAGNLSMESVRADLRQLMGAIDRLVELCEISDRPVRVCGRRSNCCYQKMISLFHDQK